jgi:folate-binding protein YgfZ
MGTPSGTNVDDPAAVAAGAALMEGPGGAAVVVRDVVAVDGPDAGSYLQGQLSQDLTGLEPGSSTWSLLLQPNGKVEAWLRVHRAGDEAYLLDVDAGWGQAVVARLARFLLRTRATIGDPEARSVLALRHAADFVAIGAGGAVAGDPTWTAGPVVGPAVAGVDRIAPRGVDATEAALADGVDLVPAAALERHRIAHLVPAMGAELGPDTIPGEAGQWLIDASVSFTKGCYTGQELVARIDSRGNTVPRPIRLLRVGEGEGTPALGDPVRHQGTEVGRVTSVAPALGPGVAALVLAVVGRGVAPGAQVEVGSDESASVATVADGPVHAAGGATALTWGPGRRAP